MKTHTTSSHHQQGSSLLEVMISLFVLAIGLLGALAMQTQSMQHNQSSYAFLQAVYLASDVVERIRANPAGNYTLAKTALAGQAQATCYSSCTVAQLQNKDLYELSLGVNSLPQGRLAVSQAANVYTISVFFDDTKNKAEFKNGAGSSEQTYTMQVRI